MKRVWRVGLVGTGLIARGCATMILKHCPDLKLTGALTRRDPATVGDFPAPALLTNSLDQLVANADLIIECSGDVVQATLVTLRAFEAGLPVVTMNSEFHVTTGSWFVGKGMLTEAEGDQPGCIAALHENAVQMGFTPLVLGNMKGFLNHLPTREDMVYWSTRQGVSIDQTTSFTDGTKVQIEQAFVANGLGGTITRQGMEGPARDDTESAAKDLAALADSRDLKIADYILSGKQFPGVFIAGKHDEALTDSLRYFKLGPGPYYALFNPHHLCSIEIVKTVRRVMAGGPPLLDNSSAPRISLAAIAKTALAAGQHIERGIGGFDMRGEAVIAAELPDHVPIGIIRNATMRRNVEPGQIICWDDIEVPHSRALEITRKLFRGQTLGTAARAA